jgi:hypothetical protein
MPERRDVGAGPKSTAAANKLAAQYNQALANEIDYNKTRSDIAEDKRPLDPAMKGQLQSRREILWQQVMDTHPGMFEADGQGRLRPKANGLSPQSQGLTIEVAAAHFKKVKGREPNAQEMANMKAALGQRAGSYSGRTMSRADLQRYANDKGLSVEQAKSEVESQGVRVQ